MAYGDAALRETAPPEHENKAKMVKGNSVMVTIGGSNALLLEEYFYNPLFVLAPIHNLG
jgi:hypothetical protein